MSRTRLICFVCALSFAATSQAADSDVPPSPGLVKSQFIYESAPFPECHASTIVETSQGLIASWFGGTRERHPDVVIWVSKLVDGKWSSPEQVADGVQNESLRHPCWNPVLFQVPGGPLHLYYKVGPSPSEWWGMMISSTDAGQTWSKPTRLPENILGPIKNKPVMLNDGRILAGSSTEHDGWRVHLESTHNLGFNWSRTKSLTSPQNIEAIQPTILQYPDKRLQILCRGKGTDRIVESWSSDNGRTWSELKTIDLPNPNSGIDGVTLADGRQLLVYNHTPRGRSPLNVSISKDGASWSAVAVLENTPGEYSYPAMIQSADGMIHITYTWKRKRIKHVVLDPAKFEPKEIRDGQWPK